MGLFSVNMNEQKTAGGSAGMKLNAGEYVLTLKEVKGVETRKLGPAVDFIFTVAEAEGESCTPVGSTVNEYCIEKNEIGAMYLKTVMVCLMGLDGNRAEDSKLIREEDWNKVLNALVIENCFAIGRKVNCSVTSAKYAKPRTDGKTHYDRKNYSPDATVRAEVLKKLAAKK